MGVVVVALALPTLGSVISHFLFGPLGFDKQVKWIFNLIDIINHYYIYRIYRVIFGCT